MAKSSILCVSKLADILSKIGLADAAGQIASSAATQVTAVDNVQYNNNLWDARQWCAKGACVIDKRKEVHGIELPKDLPWRR